MLLVSQKAYLVLADGSRFEGQSVGAEGSIIAETVFTTAMTGYMETLTDPSYYGQIVLQTFPLIGNYGVIPEDQEAAHPALRGYIMNSLCTLPSNFRGQGSLADFFKQENIIAITGIDTRALTKKLREEGVMTALLTTDKETADQADLQALNQWQAADALAHVTSESIEDLGGEGPRVILWDFGAKGAIADNLLQRGAHVLQVPAATSAQEIRSLRPDGIMLSNGPGDPKDNRAIIAEIQTLFEDQIPMFGICLGHQLLALAHGFDTFKLKYGHRGANQPVRDTKTGKVMMTSQNHGYAVAADSVDDRIALTRYISSNDNTVEGIDYLKRPIFTVQFHPEACAGPLDAQALFDRFFTLMEVR